MIFGTDISKHQGTVDFAAMRNESDMMFSIIKCTEGAEEGTPYLDPKFNENWEKLVEIGASDPTSGVYRGAYHFARYDNRQGQGEAGGENEAKWFAKNLKRVGNYGSGCIHPAIDLEVWPEGDPQGNIEFVRGFIRVIEGELGRSPMFYTGSNVWFYKFADSDEFINYPIWQVRYQENGYQEAAAPDRITKQNENWPYDIWQWSGGGEYAYWGDEFGPIGGIVNGVADVNRFDGSWYDMSDLATPFIVGGPETPDPPVEPNPQTYQPPGAALTPLVLPPEVDLTLLAGAPSPIVARVQGLLLSQGYGPTGLSSPKTGLPDGLFGKQTMDALNSFKKAAGLAYGPSLMTSKTWLILITHMM